MSIITLTSDYGNKDYFVSAIKGRILSEISEVKIIDISHDISPFHLNECAYILKNAYINFPQKSVHIIAVDTEIEKHKRHIIAYINDHYFITSDSGLLSLIFPNTNPEQIVSINISPNYDNDLFPARDIFTKVACHIIRGGTLNVVGEKINSLKSFRPIAPASINQEKSLAGEVIYIDRFGNIITNINKDIFNKNKRQQNFTIHLPRGYKINSISNSYSDVNDGTALALFNSTHLLEIAINRADKNAECGASTLLGIKEGDQIIIDFFIKK
ncbi:MAG: hypothetical protein CMP65_04930 [Flavobacteriales bacterium]|nr:hypothetical protein [Flavobacteriales bacterium]